MEKDNIKEIPFTNIINFKEYYDKFSEEEKTVIEILKEINDEFLEKNPKDFFHLRLEKSINLQMKKSSILIIGSFPRDKVNFFFIMFFFLK